MTAAKDMEHLQYSEDVHHVVYPLLDGKQEQISSFFEKFFKIVEENLLRGSILVHCAAGISRVVLSSCRAPPSSSPIS